MSASSNEWRAHDSREAAAKSTAPLDLLALHGWPRDGIGTERRKAALLGGGVNRAGK
jgi:hypothetical protein